MPVPTPTMTAPAALADVASRATSRPMDPAPSPTMIGDASGERFMTTLCQTKLHASHVSVM
ncbi:MAG: hypothetical protein JWM93_2378 [Frankiales bacterium]|nr:hypothetical protein [Frankiales bacterium]